MNTSQVRCRTFPEIENGLIVNTSRSYSYGDEGRVQCFRGFRLNGTTIIRCGADGEFTGVPTCLDIDDCAPPLSQCDQASATCINVPGSYQCQCRKGFVPNLDCRPIVDLGLGNGGVAAPAISVSGAERGFPKENVRLNTRGGWCGSQSGSGNNWVMIDFRAPVVLRGFRTQPVNIKSSINDIPKWFPFETSVGFEKRAYFCNVWN